MDQRLLDYIRECLMQGHSAEKIKDILLQRGHDTALVDEHIAAAVHGQPKQKTHSVKIIAVGIVALFLFWAVFFRGDDTSFEEYNRKLIEQKLVDAKESRQLVQKISLEHLRGTAVTDVYGCGKKQCIDMGATTLVFAEPLDMHVAGTELETFCVRNEQTCEVHHSAKIIVRDNMMVDDTIDFMEDII